MGTYESLVDGQATSYAGFNTEAEAGAEWITPRNNEMKKCGTRAEPELLLGFVLLDLIADAHGSSSAASMTLPLLARSMQRQYL